MHLHIRQLILWPHRADLSPRVLKFPSQRIGVVTGWSNTGKSAVIRIIDYVLGSSSCAIPIGPLRELVSWYGLDLETDDGLLRVARQRPTSRQVSDDYMVFPLMDDASQGDIPPEPRRNATTDEFKVRMNRLAGLSDLRLSPIDDAGWNQRASFRDMASFTLQPQHIVANPHTLFFKADSSRHREKLKRVIPVALGVLTNDHLVLQHRAELLRNELRDLEAQQRRRLASLETWRTTATSQYVRAQELGLLAAKEPPAEVGAINRELSALLTKAPEATSVGNLTRDALTRLQATRDGELRLDRRVSDLRRKLKRLRSMSASFTQYADVISEQQAMVSGVGWFARRITGANECPICGSESTSAKQALAELRAPLAALEDIAGAARHDRPMVDRDAIATERALYEAERLLMQQRRLRIELETAVPKEGGQRLEDVYRFLGNVEHALRTASEPDAGLTTRIVDLTIELRGVTSDLNEGARREAEKEALKQVGELIADYAKAFGVEAVEGQPVLDVRELTVRFDPEQEDRTASFLWEIGSGANWMGYHIATLLAIHDYLYRRVPASPVPTFLVIDQPSQVFFPSDTYDQLLGRGAEASRSTDAAASPKLDRDLQRTRQIFETLARGFRRLGGHLQIVVLEHADQAAWGHLEEFELVADWHKSDDALLPPPWFAPPDPGETTTPSTTP
ncbi:MAG: hypothetical protein ABS36_06390 [Acidobacteria bacterium SCN 69-37]|nr:MAG: hypothetical protein ABS36_06390 [Acidobacteria bacterium SCN 69-37]